jgi:hypothetical protein
MPGVLRELCGIVVRGRSTSCRETAARSSIPEFFSLFFFLRGIVKEDLMGEAKEYFGDICKIKRC